MRKLLSAIAIALSLWAAPAFAQNTTCSDRPAGDSSNACANTRFVSRSASSINTYTPEQYYQSSDGTNWGLAIDRAIQALQVLPNGGTLKLACGTTYTISTVSGNGLSAVRLYDKVNIIGCGDNSVIKIADNVNTSSVFFIYGLFRTGSLNNVIYADFTVDMNGANNSCSQTCWQQNAAMGASSGNDITVRHVRFINNPGSNNTVFGSSGVPTPVTNLKLQDLIHEHNGSAVNSAATDFSSDYFYASNWTYSNITHSDGGTLGSAFEIHSAGGGTATGIVVTDHFNCGIIANELTSLATVDVNLSGFKCSRVKNGLQIYSRVGGTNTNINITSGIIDFLTGFSGIGVDASSVINAATGANINLNVSNVQIKSDVTTNLGNDSAGISLGRWTNVKVNNNQCYLTQGPCIRVIATASGAALQFHDNQINFPGKTNNTALQAGIVVDSTAVTADYISIQGNTIDGVVRYAVIGAQNASSGYLLSNLAPFASVGQYNWTGTGMIVLTLPGASAIIAGTNISQTFSALQQFGDSFFQLNGSTSGLLLLRAAATSGSSTIRFPAGSTDFSATGGTSFVVRQSSVGAALTVSQLACADLIGAGAGCTAAAGITALTGDATATGPGSVPITFATVNANVGSFGSATQTGTFTVNGKGLLTAAANVTITPSIGSITGLGAGCATWLATPSSTNFASCLTGETGTGVVVFNSLPNIIAPVFQDFSDNTKQFQLILNGITTGNTRSWTVPDSNDTFVGLTATQTLSNKTFVAPALGTPASGIVTNLTGTASININGTVGATTPTTGAFTTVITSTSETTPRVIGGTGAASTLTLDSTSGAGTTDATIFRTASQVERARITTGGLFNIGPSAVPDAILTVNSNTVATAASGSAYNIHIVGANSASPGIVSDAFAGQNLYTARSATGTAASPTQITGSTLLLGFTAQALDNAATYRSSVVFELGTIGTVTSTDAGGFFRVRTMAAGTVVLTERIRIQQGLSVGNTTDPGVGVVSATGGYVSNGLAGITTVCTIAVGNVLTFTLGILTAKGGAAGCT